MGEDEEGDEEGEKEEDEEEKNVDNSDPDTIKLHHGQQLSPALSNGSQINQQPDNPPVQSVTARHFP